MSELGHPSFLALDRYAVSEAGGPSIADHIERCDRCAAQVKRVQAWVPVPEWARSLSEEKGLALMALANWRPWAVRSLWGAASLAGVAAAVVLVARLDRVASDRDETVPAETTSIRGAPAVAVHVLRGTRVRLWRPGMKLQRGDRFRIEVSPDGYSQVALFSVGRDARLTRLHEGVVDPNGSTVLPAAWELDDDPGPETLVVVFAKSPIEQELVRRAVRAGRSGEAGDGLWVRQMVFEKRDGEEESP